MTCKYKRLWPQQYPVCYTKFHLQSMWQPFPQETIIKAACNPDWVPSITLGHLETLWKSSISRCERSKKRVLKGHLRKLLIRKPWMIKLKKYLLQILAALQNNFKQWKFNQYYRKHFFKYFSTTSKTVVKTQSWIELLWNSISLCFLFLFCFETPLKDFPFYSLILLTLALDTYKLT